MVEIGNQIVLQYSCRAVLHRYCWLPSALGAQPTAWLLRKQLPAEARHALTRFASGHSLRQIAYCSVPRCLFSTLANIRTRKSIIEVIKFIYTFYSGLVMTYTLRRQRKYVCFVIVHVQQIRALRNVYAKFKSKHISQTDKQFIG